MTMQMPPWLEELSDDWPSETSSIVSSTSRRPSKSLPRSQKTQKPRSLKPRKHRSSRTALGDRDGNAVFLNQGDAHQSTAQDFGGESWGIGVQSPQSTINGGTVQQKPPRASPTKATHMANVPEWKKRLVHGDMPYGEQKDLFSPIGLQNIFRQVSRVDEQTNRLRVKKDKSPIDRNSSIDRGKSDCGNNSGQSSAVHRSRYTNKQKTSYKTSEIGDRLSSGDTQYPDQETECLSDGNEFPHDRRFVSGQTELNEEFSPVFISKQSTVNGRVNYAAHGSNRNNIEQKVLGPTDSQNIPLRLRKEKPNCEKSQVSMLSGDLSTGTPDIAELGDFVTWKRGGYSAENSFRDRPLSPSPARQIRSQVLNSHGLLYLGTASTETQHVRTPPRASESHQSTPRSREYLTQASNSPLKLFGNHDTFTNHQLLRRMGQLQDSGKLTSSDNQCEHVTAAGTALSSMIKPNKSLTNLSASKSNMNDNYTESHMKLSNIPISRVTSNEREAVCQTSTPTEMTNRSQSSTQSDRSLCSSIVISGSELPINCTASFAPTRSSLYNKLNPAETLRKSSHTHVINTSNKGSTHPHSQKAFEPFAFADGKRPQSSPTKSPTPKRRRTLPQLETSKQIHEESEVQEVVRFSQSPQKEESSFSDESNNANLDMVSQRLPQPPKIVSDYRQKQERAAGELLFQGHKSELEPISEDGEFQATQKKQFAWNSRGAAHDGKLAYSNTQADTRKHSLTTQDYIDEAMKIMSWIRSNRPKSGLASLEEAESEQLDESMDSEASMTLSRPPSREGRTTKWRDPNSHELHSRVNSHLQKYREDDNDNIVLSSLEALRMSDPSEEPKASQTSSDTIRITHNTSFVDAGTEEGTVQASNVPNDLNTHNSDHSDKFSSGRTNMTEGSRRSENVTTFAPEAVAHLIPKEIAGMTFDKERGMWIRVPNSPNLKDIENRDLSTTESDDDPLKKIPDLIVDKNEHNDGATLDRPRYPEELGDVVQGNALLNYKNTSGSEKNEKDINHQSSKRVRENLSGNTSNEIQQYHDALTPFPVTKDEEHIAVDHEYSIDEGRAGSHKGVPCGRKGVAVSFPTQLLAHMPPLRDRRKTWQHLEASVDNGLRRPGMSSSKNSQRRQSVRFSSETRTAEPISLNTQKESTTCHCVQQHERIRETRLQTADRSKSNPEVAIAVTSPSGCQNGAAVTAIGSPGTVADVTFYLNELSEFTVNQIDEREFNCDINDKEVVFYRKVAPQPFEVSTGELVKVLQDAKPEELYWEDIRHLVINGKNLNTLHKLNDFCSQLQALSVAQNNLRQLAGAPPSIRQLDASRNQLSSLTTWAHLTNLQYLDVSGNNIDSLAGFGDLVHLRELRADNNQLASLDGILTLDALIKLSLGSNEFAELNFTSSKFTRMTELNLSNNSIETVHGLQHLHALERLDLDENKIKIFPEDRSTTPLCSRLLSLNLERNGLEQIEIGKRFPKLKELYIDNNDLSCIKGAKDGERLEILSARYQRALGKAGCTFPMPYDIAYLAHHDVRQLFLSSNSISTLQISTSHMNLEHFELASSGLHSLPTNFGVLAPNLRTVNLNCNSLKDFTPLLGLKKLKSLTIAGNRLIRLRKSIAVLQSLPDLQRLDLRDNPITVGFYEPIIQNKLLKREDNGLLERNPGPYEIAAASSEADVRYRTNLDEATQLRRRVYEMLIATHCPKLQFLDGLPFNKENVKIKDTSWARLIDLGVIKASKAGMKLL